MQTYLYLHREHTSGPQERYRGKYLLKQMDYNLSRAVGRKGEIISDVQGGNIRVAINGFADAILLAWLYDSMRKEDGAIVTIDEEEKVVNKLHFSEASASTFRLNYDSRVREGAITLVTINAKEIKTDNDLYFERRK